MGQIWIREFLGGIDTRRLPETTPGGVLKVGENGHITRGGEFQSRAAFVEAYSLPAGTIGLARTRLGLYVFGSIEAPAVPSGVTYVRIRHPDEEEGEPSLVSVPSFSLFAGGKIYVVGVFSDGSRHHFYDGERVDDWYDGRARVSFRVVGGGYNPATPAQGSFRVTGGSLGGGNEISAITVGGVSIITSAIAHTGDDEETAEDVADEINATTSVPNYTAAAVGDQVFIVAEDAGELESARTLAVTEGGDVTYDDVVNVQGGTDATTSQVTAATLDGVPILVSPIDWTTSNEDTASAIAAAISATVSSPSYSAIAVGDTVIISADEAGTAANGRVLSTTVANGMLFDPASGAEMAGGSEEDDTYNPGTFVKAISEKMYSPSGPVLHFSGIRTPAGWTTDNTGAGFIDMSSQAEGLEDLKAVERYQQYVAVFGENAVMIWYIDPDPELYRPVQVLGNTGTFAPLSVTQFGDTDLFYLDESGVRSLRARDSSGLASTSDVGSKIDGLIQAKLATLTEAERANAIGLIEPSGSRFWLIVKDTIYVLSFFTAETTVSAWTTYKTTYQSEGEAVSFDVDAAVVFNKKVWLRSGDKIYVYGGTGSSPTYDDTQATVQLPYLDADRPTQTKTFTGIDAAMRGEWQVKVALSVYDDQAVDVVGVINRTTYDVGGKVGGVGKATHISPIFLSQGDGPHTLGAVVIHHDLDDDEDS